ncbi:putative F-box protein At2g02030 [Salvia hispanica]|uniref:putative F-box protein At2g02030 n=1 Tax=Salvia hispanica TaxID=49212 RepID=UPI0020094B7C|nr:putative F-box protein At2g02030 [Salvia hispanica]
MNCSGRRKMSAELVADDQCKPFSQHKDDLYLPQELCKDILSRLPIRSILRFKCVYKPWRNLIEGGEFATSYTVKPCLAFNYGMGYGVCDETFQPLLRFNFPRCDKGSRRAVINSANGLLLVRNGCNTILSVCNPMTCECIELPPLMTLMNSEYRNGRGVILGFGVSKLSGQYKIVSISEYSRASRSSYCEIYTLESGGGLWRSITTPAVGSLIPGLGIAAFLNGNLHWMASGSKESGYGGYNSEENLLVCRCFDLETEIFTSFSLPHVDNAGDRDLAFVGRQYGLCVLEDQLCFCGILQANRVDIWCMEDYGDDKSWIKKYAFLQTADILGPVLPLKVLANDDLLFAVHSKNQLFIYSKNAQTVTGGLLKPFLCRSSYVAIYTPNFLSLKAMGIHNVQALSFD